MRRWAATLGVAGLVALGVNYVRGRLTIERHVADYADHWRRRVDVPEDAIHYVALGDSAAQGVGASTVEAGYVALLAGRIAEATGRRVVVTNLSASSATTRDVVREQLPRLVELERAPDIVTLDAGGNDVVLPGNNLESFEKHFADIVAVLPRGSFVADVPWFTLPGLARRSEKFTQAAAPLIGVYGHHQVPVHAAARALGPLRYHQATAGDWFHPNDAGHRAWADLFWEAMEDSGRMGFLRSQSLG
jgi:putative esterase/lipase